MKTVLKTTEIEMCGVSDIETLLLASFASVTCDDCNGWFSNSGIY